MNILSIKDSDGKVMKNNRPIDRDNVYIWLSVIIVLCAIWYGVFKLIF